MNTLLQCQSNDFFGGCAGGAGQGDVAGRGGGECDGYPAFDFILLYILLKLNC